MENAGRSASISADVELLIFVGCLLDQLQAINRNWRQLVELKYLRGLTDKEAAEAMRIPLRTLQRMCADARQWLSERADPEGIRRSRRRGATGLCGIQCRSVSVHEPRVSGAIRVLVNAGGIKEVLASKDGISQIRLSTGEAIRKTEAPRPMVYLRLLLYPLLGLLLPLVAIHVLAWVVSGFSAPVTLTGRNRSA